MRTPAEVAAGKQEAKPALLTAAEVAQRCRRKSVRGFYAWAKRQPLLAAGCVPQGTGPKPRLLWIESFVDDYCRYGARGAPARRRSA